MPPGMLTARAVALLKSDKVRGFRVDVEDQSTIAADDNAEQLSRTAFLGAVGQFLQQSLQVPPNLAPALAPMLGKMLLFGARAFRAGSEMETAIETAVGKLQQIAANPPPTPPDPKAALIPSQIALNQAKAGQMAQQGQQKQMELVQAAQQDRIQNQQDDRQHGIDMARMQMEGHDQHLDATRLQGEHQEKEAQFMLEMRKLELQAQQLELERERFQHEKTLPPPNRGNGAAH